MHPFLDVPILPSCRESECIPDQASVCPRDKGAPVPHVATIIKQSATLILRALEANQTCSDGVGRFTPLWRSLEPIFAFERFNDALCGA